jgi:AcrR family transcriptional regulator
VSVKKLSTELNYLGRPAKRADSRERREAILDAALRVIEREGVRGVRHRAVAKEAGVPLAATTYYFEDIHALLHDSFVHYIDRDKGNSKKLEQKGFSALQSFSPEQLMLPEIRKTLTKLMSGLLFDHLQEQVAAVADRNIEAAFRHEAMRDELLAKPVLQLHEAQITSLTEFFTLMGSPAPYSDARLIMATMLYLEHDILLYSAKEYSWEEAKKTIERLVESLTLF